ncbi:MAG: site-specific integrase [Microcystis aeruginosa K13-06]|nr:site-specific integrase [Microcystis aeruginosa K13-06]
MTDNLVLLNSKVSHLSPVPPSIDWGRVLSDWLNTKRSPHTRRVYCKDIDNFLADIGTELGKFLTLDRHGAFELVSRYKGDLLQKGLKSATINRRLAAIKSLVAFSYNCGHSEFMLEAVKGEKLCAYRDTTGVDPRAVSFKLSIADFESINLTEDSQVYLVLTKRVSHNN